MPFYEYEPKSGSCHICHGRFADLQKLSDLPHQKCPKCNQEVTRVISLPSVPVFRTVEQHMKSQTKKRQSTANRTAQKKTDSSEILVTETAESAPVEATSSSHSTHDCQALGCFKTAEKLLNKK